MANATVSYGGRANGAGTVDALFLEVYGGEVLVAFERQNVTMSRHTVRTISSGKSAQFPSTWKATAYTHIAGEELDFKVVHGNERTIVIDDLLVAPVFIDILDEAKAHWEVRSVYTNETGIVLANHMDQNVLRAMVTAARGTHNITQASPAYDGGQLTDVNMGSVVATLKGGIFDAALALDEKDVPQQGRSAFVRPAQFYMLIEDKDFLNKDWGGAGGISTASLPRAADLEIVKTNNIPDADDSANTEIPVVLRDNYLPTVFVVTHPSAVGTVKLLDLQTEGEYDLNRQGHMIVSKYAVGHGVLRTEAAVTGQTS